MKKVLVKPNLRTLVKSEMRCGAVVLAATKDECTDPGTKYQGQVCKGSKCGNGAGGCQSSST